MREWWSEMNFEDKSYIGGIAVVGILAALALAAVPAIPTLEQLMILWLLVALAIAAQFFEVNVAEQRSYSPHNVFFFAGVLLLPPLLLVPLFAISLTVDAWRGAVRAGGEEISWRDLLFNIASHSLIGASASLVYFGMNESLANLMQIGQVVAALVAATTYVLGNHLIFRLADMLINGATWRESAIWMTENLATELVMTYLGYVVAVLWFVNPVMILPMLGLMFLLQQALMIPRLQMEAQTDSKTGLLNVRYFNQRFDELLERAKRTERPLSIMMADLDYLRRINNNYGHLAGDLVLIGISQVIKRTVRAHDIVGRFGGEEFAILLPDTDQEEAIQVAEAIRLAIAESGFDVPTSPSPIRTTMSLGIACYPQDADSATDLLHHADVAVYQAKMDGRNRVICADDLFYRIKGNEGLGPEDDSHADHPPKPKLLDLPVHVPQPSTDQLPDEPIYLPRWYRWLSDTALKSMFVGLALLITLMGIGLERGVDWSAVLILVGLTAVAQFLRLRLFASGELSIAAALIFTTALLTGISGLALVSLVVVFTSILNEGSFDLGELWERKLEWAHDWAIGVLAGLTPALFTALFNVPLNMAYLPLLFVPLFLVIMAYSYSGVGLIAFTLSVTTGKRFRQVWNDDFQHAPAQYILMSMIGVCFALVYGMFGTIGFLLCALPIFFMRFAQEPVMGQWSGFTAALSRHLGVEQPTQILDEKGHGTLGVPMLVEADKARIERYLQFRNDVRTA
ncbi:MAG: GGDEF domain-containing protein [Caldilineaceae bacterium]|nr:GGDEF domain-containing protein [Caldilineaceae bacterium]